MKSNRAGGKQSHVLKHATPITLNANRPFRFDVRLRQQHLTNNTSFAGFILLFSLVHLASYLWKNETAIKNDKIIIENIYFKLKL